MNLRTWLTARRPFGLRISFARAAVATLILMVAAFPAMAGSGVVNNDGTIDITLNLRFPPTAGDFTTVQDQVTAASAVLWDASEGQLRFGKVILTAGAVNEDLADMWVFAQDGRAGVEPPPKKEPKAAVREQKKNPG